MPHTASWPKWAFIVAIVVIGLGVFKFGESLFFEDRSRDPASDTRGPDLSALLGPEFMINARIRLVEGLTLTTRDGRIYLTAGHFLGPNNPISICSTYNDIEYEFAAEDQASSGDPITITLTSDCEASRNGGKLEELEVPVDRVLREKPRDTEFQVYGKRNVTVKLENIDGDWPKEWALRSVRLFNSSNEIGVEGSELYRLRGKPLQMKW